ncbi:MAG: PocR ligand-binding domain-containing protein, partial [Propionivibrio sp.]
MAIRNGEPFIAGLPEHLQAMAAHFASVSGVSCFPVDAEGKAFVDSSPSQAGDGAASREVATASRNPGCLFCRSATLRKLANVADCPAIHRYGIFQAERFGGSFVYFCPAKLVHWASPVLVDGRIVGALIAGSVLMIEPEDYLSEEVRVPLSLTAGEAAALRAQFKQIPYVPPSRVSSLARILADMAFSLSQKMSIDSAWTNNLEGQQARISEYIHQLKSDASGGNQQTYPLAKEKALLALIAQGDHENASELLSELLATIVFICGQNMALIRARSVELVVLMSRAAVDGGAAVDVALELNNV